MALADRILARDREFLLRQPGPKCPPFASGCDRRRCRAGLERDGARRRGTADVRGHRQTTYRGGYRELSGRIEAANGTRALLHQGGTDLYLGQSRGVARNVFGTASAQQVFRAQGPCNRNIHDVSPEPHAAGRSGDPAEGRTSGIGWPAGESAGANRCRCLIDPSATKKIRLLKPEDISFTLSLFAPSET